jgi:hypothetical protein
VLLYRDFRHKVHAQGTPQPASWTLMSQAFWLRA